MNAAFLLVTGAMLVGQGGDKKPAPAPAPAVVTSSCCNTDPCGCESWGHRLRNKMGGLFHRDNCDSCQPATCNSGHGLFNRGCDTGCNNNNCCQPKFWKAPCHDNKACAPTCAPTCNDSCGGHSFNLLSKLRDRFHRNDCCDGGCASTVAPAPVKGEKIEPPAKKLPVKPPEPKKPAEEVRIDPAPIAPGTISPLPTPPAVEITPVPVPVPRVEGDRRDPF